MYAHTAQDIKHTQPGGIICFRLPFITHGSGPHNRQWGGRTNHARPKSYLRTVNLVFLQKKLSGDARARRWCAVPMSHGWSRVRVALRVRQAVHSCVLEGDADAAARGVFDGLFDLVVEAVVGQAATGRPQGGEVGIREDLWSARPTRGRGARSRAASRV